MNIPKQIPNNLDEAIESLRASLDARELEYLKTYGEDCMSQAHHTAGMALRNAWHLWREGPLKTWFKQRGIWHADDMSGIILTSLWRAVNEKPLELEAQIQHYKDYWKEHYGLTGEPPNA